MNERLLNIFVVALVIFLCLLLIAITLIGLFGIKCVMAVVPFLFISTLLLALISMFGAISLLRKRNRKTFK